MVTFSGSDPIRRNSIHAERGSSEYLSSHVILVVDGRPFNDLLNELAPDLALGGLVPSLVGCADNAEAQVVRERILPAAGEVTIAPVLICPDDLDLSCTVVVVEAVGSSDAIEWRRVGLDCTEWHAVPDERVGKSVDWFAHIAPFTFRRDDYTRALEAFRELWMGDFSP